MDQLQMEMEETGRDATKMRNCRRQCVKGVQAPSVKARMPCLFKHQLYNSRPPFDWSRAIRSAGEGGAWYLEGVPSP